MFRVMLHKATLRKFHMLGLEPSALSLRFLPLELERGVRELGAHGRVGTGHKLGSRVQGRGFRGVPGFLGANMCWGA